jgi:cell division septal protein FtsQ
VKKSRPSRKPGGQSVSRRGKATRRILHRALPAAATVLAVIVIVAASYIGGPRGWRWLSEKVISSPVFRLEGVLVRGNRNVSDEEAVRVAGVTMGESILAMDLESLRRRLLAYPLVRSASVQRRLPSALVIELEERVPVALVRSGRNFIVDRDGKVMSVTEGDVKIPLPCLTGVAILDGRVTAAAMEDLGAGLELMEAVRAGGFPSPESLDCIDVSNGNDAVIVPVRGRPLVHVGRENLEERLKRLKLVAADISARKQEIEYIELRAEGQVIAKPIPPADETGGEEG